MLNMRLSGLFFLLTVLAARCCIPDSVVSYPAELKGNGAVEYRFGEDGCATWYQVRIQRNGQDWYSKWFHTGEPTLRGTIPITLNGHSYGTYTWWIRGYNEEGGYGAWSEPRTFEYGRLRPVGPCCRLSASPYYVKWINETTEDDADYFQVFLAKDGEKFWSKWIPRSQTRDSGNGKRDFTLPGDLTPLPYGKYGWWVRGWNSEAGYMPWSREMEFVLGGVSPLTPNGNLGPNYSRISWGASPSLGAEWYQIWINRGHSKYWQKWISVAQTVDEGGDLRSYLIPQALDLPYGTYTWKIRVWADGSVGPWSEDMAFHRGQAMPLSPSGSVTSVTQLRWDDLYYTSDADGYHLWINRGDTMYWKQWVQLADTVGDGTQRYFNLPAMSLPGGSYTWYLKPWNASAGEGLWSEGMPFHVD